MTTMEFRKRYDPSPKRTVECTEPGAKQEHKDECDINRIMARYNKTGALPPEQREALFQDVSEVGDYLEALQRVSEAQAQFESLPAKVRERFRNDPSELLAFLPTATTEQLEELDLLAVKPKVVVPAGQVVTETLKIPTTPEVKS